MKLPQFDEVFMPGSRVQDLALPEVEFYWEPYIPKDAIVLAHGKFGTFKTPVLSNVAKAISTGQEVLNCGTKKGRVLFVQADTPKRVIVPRLQQLGVAIQDLDFAFCYPGFDVVTPHEDGELSMYFYQLLSKIHRENTYDVVFIDSLRAIHRLDDKEATTVHTVYRACHKLFYDASIVLIHHDKKFNKDSKGDETFSGSQAWANHATVTLKFSHVDQDAREIQIEHLKTQASELTKPLRVKIADDGVSILRDSGSDLQSIADFIVGLEAEGFENADVMARLAEYYGFGLRTARRRKAEAHKLGMLDEARARLGVDIRGRQA